MSTSKNRSVFCVDSSGTTNGYVFYWQVVQNLYIKYGLPSKLVAWNRTAKCITRDFLRSPVVKKDSKPSTMLKYLCKGIMKGKKLHYDPTNPYRLVIVTPGLFTQEEIVACGRVEMFDLSAIDVFVYYLNEETQSINLNLNDVLANKCNKFVMFLNSTAEEARTMVTPLSMMIYDFQNVVPVLFGFKRRIDAVLENKSHDVFKKQQLTIMYFSFLVETREKTMKRYREHTRQLTKLYEANDRRSFAHYLNCCANGGCEDFFRMCDNEVIKLFRPYIEVQLLTNKFVRQWVYNVSPIDYNTVSNFERGTSINGDIAGDSGDEDGNSCSLTDAITLESLESLPCLLIQTKGGIDIDDFVLEIHPFTLLEDKNLVADIQKRIEPNVLNFETILSVCENSIQTEDELRTQRDHGGVCEITSPFTRTKCRVFYLEAHTESLLLQNRIVLRSLFKNKKVTFAKNQLLLWNFLFTYLIFTHPNVDKQLSKLVYNSLQTMLDKYRVYISLSLPCYLPLERVPMRMALWFLCKVAAENHAIYPNADVVSFASFGSEILRMSKKIKIL